MKFSKIAGGALAATVLFLSSNASAIEISPASGDYTFSFSGKCSDCTGSGTGSLTVSNFTPGDDLSTATFDDFTYTSNLTTYDIFFLGGASGVMNTTPGQYDVSISGLAFVGFPESFGPDSVSSVGLAEFQSGADGSWSTSINSIDLDQGTLGTWNGVPEPATWLMMLVGFGGLGAALRHARKTAPRLA